MNERAREGVPLDQGEAIADRSGAQPIPRAPAKPSALRPIDTIAVLAIVFVIFLYIDGPVWRHPWEPLRSILLSYAFIPPLVLPILIARRRFGFGAWLFESFRVAVMKFLLTAAFLMVCWIFGAAPRDLYKKPLVIPSAGTDQASSVLVVPRDHAAYDGAAIADGSASIGGVVRGADGAPLVGALVYVSSGLEDLDYAPPKEPLALVDDGHGFHDADGPVVFVQTGRTVEVRSTDGKLHTFLLRGPSGETLASVPILSSGAPRAIVFADSLGPTTLRCAVHEAGNAEADATWIVRPHPFFAYTGADGRFTIGKLPAREVRVATISRDGVRGAEAALTLHDGATAEATLSVP